MANALFLVGLASALCLGFAERAWSIDDQCSVKCKPGQFLNPVACECIPLDELPQMPACMLVCNEPGQVMDPFHCKCIAKGQLSDLLLRVRKKVKH